MPFNNDYVKYRIKKAKETFKAAEILYENEVYSSVVNRLYYSCFYMILALLASQNIEAKTHRGVKVNFNKYFIKTGKINLEFSRIYSTLFDWRLKDDYDDFVEFSKSDIDIFLVEVEKFVLEIEKFINKSN